MRCLERQVAVVVVMRWLLVLRVLGWLVVQWRRIGPGDSEGKGTTIRSAHNLDVTKVVQGFAPFGFGSAGDAHVPYLMEPGGEKWRRNSRRKRQRNSRQNSRRKRRRDSRR